MMNIIGFIGITIIFFMSIGLAIFFIGCFYQILENLGLIELVRNFWKQKIKIR